MRRRIFRLLIGLLVVALASVCIAQHKHQARRTKGSGEAAVRRFVQRFYDWYTPLGLKETKGDTPPADTQAVTLRPQWFSPELRRAMLEDRKAQDKAPGYLVGLDFDPFVDAQDTPIRCFVRGAKRKDRTWLVRVQCRYGHTTATSDPVAVVERTKDGWRFCNFISKGGTDLLTLLRGLKHDRERRE